MKWAKIIGKTIAALVKTIAALVLGFALLVGCLMAFMYWITPDDHRGCAPDSEAAEYARSLPQERLGILYNDMERHYQLGSDHKIEYSQLPEFSDLQVRTIRPWRALITVEGCFDNYMYMNFDGITNDKPQGIYLSCGEFENECNNEPLWPE